MMDSKVCVKCQHVRAVDSLFSVCWRCASGPREEDCCHHNAIGSCPDFQRARVLRRVVTRLNLWAASDWPFYFYSDPPKDGKMVLWLKPKLKAIAAAVGLL